MPKKLTVTTIISISLVGLGVISLALNLIFGWTINFGWPILIIFFGWVFYLLAGYLIKEWKWADLLYIPASFLLAIGFIFLLNVVTNDWNAWAYAWMLLITGLALGVLLANRGNHWPNVVNHFSVGLIIASMTFCTLFGILVGGRFFLVMASVLLVMGGIGFYWFRPAINLPNGLTGRLKRIEGPEEKNELSPRNIVDSISSREIEVLRLIEKGLTNSEIAEKLNLAPSTVKTHINNIFSKLGVQTRIQALNRAKDLGVLD